MGLVPKHQITIRTTTDLPGRGEEVRVVVPVVTFPVVGVNRKISGHPITIHQGLCKVAGQIRALTRREF